MAQSQDTFGTSGVAAGRATVPVIINGQGPFQFAVDSAANCSVISRDLLEVLDLRPTLRLAMHTLVGREMVDAVVVERLSSGALNQPFVRLAVGSRPAMAGLDGLLGSDLLADKRLILNFRGGVRARIGGSRTSARGFLDPADPQTSLVVAGERRFESLMMIEARVGSTPALAIIDSGAEGTILNRAAAIAGRAQPLILGDGTNRSRIQSPTGREVAAEVMVVRSIGFAGISVTRPPVIVGDFHTFDLWGLSDRPAMLLGIDVLSLFDSVFIDLKRGEFSVRA